MKKNFFGLIIMFMVFSVTVYAQSGNSTDLLLPEGEAWIKATGNLSSGYIFQSDEICFSVNNYDGENIGEWVIVAENTWVVSGNTIIITSTNSGAARDYNYKISDNTLTLDFWGTIDTYTKTSGIKPVR